MVKDSRNQMIEDNIGLVHSIAKRFVGRGVDYEDLFQTGCIGLIKAVDHFDESKGFRFSTYAVPVIMGEIKRIFRDGGAIKVSRALKEKSMKAQLLRERFSKKELRDPTVSELADMLGCDVDETVEILNVINPMLSLNSFGEDASENLDVPFDNREEIFDKIRFHRSWKNYRRKNDSSLIPAIFRGKRKVKQRRNSAFHRFRSPERKRRS